jgi:ATP-dependent RNA helicase RhlE
LNYFQELGLSEKLATRLAEIGLTEPTLIQSKAIPLVLDGRDVMGLAQTGTGKTAAFGTPLVQILNGIGEKPAPKSPRALILAPTRELARQIMEHLTSYIGKSHLKVTMIVGGSSIGAQIKRMERGTDIMVATPGRLIDLTDRRAVDLSSTKYLVLDEADQMLDLGFIHALRAISKMLPEQRQTMLFSATMPKLMAEISAAYLTDPVRVQAAPPGKIADKITQGIHYIDKGEKTGLLKKLLATHRGEKSIVFSRTKHGAERLMKGLVASGFSAGSIHGNKSQGQRDRALAAFKSGELDVLVATDVAARGIDIPLVKVVYNYDLPNVPENYVHRIGRTARAGADGKAVAFCGQDEVKELRQIEKVLGFPIPLEGGSPWVLPKGDIAAPGGKSPGRGGPRRRTGGGGGGGGGFKGKSAGGGNGGGGGGGAGRSRRRAA